MNIIDRIADKLVWLSPLLARITLGGIFVPTGWGKLQNLEQVTIFFQQLGIPAARLQAPMVSGLELVCGLMILVGAFTRWATLPLMAIMAVAIATAKRADITGFTSLLGFTEFLYFVLLLWLFTAGPGRVSVDQQWRSQQEPTH
jgi:putative oxidoreductase